MHQTLRSILGQATLAQSILAQDGRVLNTFLHTLETVTSWTLTFNPRIAANLWIVAKNFREFAEVQGFTLWTLTFNPRIVETVTSWTLTFMDDYI